MTPQLRQAIRLLQASRLELIEEIRKETTAAPGETVPAPMAASVANEAIVADVAVVRDGNGWTVTYNEVGALREPHREVPWLGRVIEARRETILRIVEHIAAKQRDFLEHGTLPPKPMTVAAVAAALEMHEATVSRAITNEYVHTPHGVFELKYFFES